MRSKITILLLLCALISSAQNINFQSIPNDDGIIRCHTMEMDSILRSENPDLPTLHQQEDWLQEKIAQYKSGNLASLRSGGIITIPTVFHVITDGVGEDNVPASLIYAQLDQLNLDFRNLSGSTDPVAADIEIEFCAALLDTLNNVLVQPGINRVTTFGGGSFSTGFVNGTIKPNTIWDPTQYLNVWVADLSGGILGYAQFPDSSGLAGFSINEGAANTDGVVVLNTSVGSVAMPHPAGGPYNLGRTLTHEVGHWIGLRHIWGDGGCSVDDFCDDTPASNAPNFGCPSGHVSCGTIDMIENYMDYTEDDCMDIFTLDQKDRIATVMMVSPRRKELCNSTKCSVNPVIAFVEPNGSDILEATDCSYQDIPIEMSIVAAPSDTAFVTLFTVSGTTAEVNEDFELLSNVVTFPPGSSANQSATLRVYNDGVVESTEFITFGFGIVTTGDAIAASGATSLHTRSIIDDDVAPSASGMTTLLFEDFEADFVIDPFTTTGNSGSDRFLIGDAVTASSSFWTTTGNSTQFAYSNDDECNCNKANDNLLTPVIDLSAGYNAVTLTFDHAFSDNAGEVGTVDISTGGPFITVDTLVNTSVGGAFKTTPWVNGFTVDLTPYSGEETVIVRFHYDDDGAWAYGMAIDNVLITADAVGEIQTTVNSGVPQAIPIDQSQIVHYYDPTSGNIMMTIENISSWDFECTTVEVDRDVATAGSGSLAFNNTDTANRVASKTFFVDATNDLPTGSYQIYLYYTEAEIAAWEAETGNVRSEIEIIKVSENPLSLVNAGNYGSFTVENRPGFISSFGSDGVIISAGFNTGFSGFGAGILGQPALLPVELLDFYAEKSDKINIVKWQTATEVNASHFVLKKSSNGVDFEEMRRVEASGNSTSLVNYSSIDDNPFSTTYYQLEQIDFDGSSEESQIIALSRRENAGFTVSPNPFKDQIEISFMNPGNNPVDLKFIDSKGRVVYSNSNVSQSSIIVDSSTFAKGVYQLIVISDEISIRKVLKL